MWAQQLDRLRLVSEADPARLADIGVDGERHAPLLGKALEPLGAGLRTVLADVDHPAARHPLHHP
jgi:hypothetical protein